MEVDLHQQRETRGDALVPYMQWSSCMQDRGGIRSCGEICRAKMGFGKKKSRCRDDFLDKR